MPTSFAIIAAAKDANLTDRIAALMAALNVQDPDYESQQLRRAIVLAPITVNGEETTIATVREYAATLRDQAIAARDAAIAQAEADHPVPCDPGLDPAAVTDGHIRAAIQVLIDQGVLPTKR